MLYYCRDLLLQLKSEDKIADKKLASNQLDTLIEKNKHLFTNDFDWKTTLEDAVNSKYCT